MDRGYDKGGIFLKLAELRQDYVIRLTSRRKLFFHGKRIPATELRERRKGKIKLATNALNFYITLGMAFLAHLSMKPETNALKVSIIQTAPL